jgi:F0F1-type ATP synthase membrane subunit b/b'
MGALVLAAEPALAAKMESPPTWRIWWSHIWRVLNFLVLAFAAYKLGKKPLLEFLSGQKDTIQKELKELEDQKAKLIAEKEALEAKTRQMSSELEDYQEKLERLAQKERTEMLEDAKRETELIVERAGLWSEQLLRQAKQKLADEMLKEAAELATQKIKENINSQDRSLMVEEFKSQIAEQAKVA